MKYLTKNDLIIKKRKPDSHKGQSGKVMIIGGSIDYVGAVALAGLAALRTGVDWVTVAVPEKVGWAINALSPDLVVKKYKGDDFCASRAKDILRFEQGFDAVLIGNGIGMHANSFVRKYVKDSKKRLVIDADALKHISLDDVDDCILTPHNKELEVLLGNSKIDKKIIDEKSIEKRSLSIKNLLDKKNKNIIILWKGKVDVIISKERIAFNKTGNPGMAKAGTGDILAGLCVGFLGQGIDTFSSACNAAYINGILGDLQLKKKKGYSYIASDLLDDIRKVICKGI